jgi:hypothetical protein
MNCIRFFSRQTEWVPSPRTTWRFRGVFTSLENSSCAMYRGVSWSHSATMTSVGTSILAGSYVGFPAAQ